MSIINVDSISDAAGTGSPSFPNGISLNSLTATGAVTAGNFIGSESNPAITSADADGYLGISGDATVATGGNIRLFSAAHATNANNILFRNNTTTALKYDSSATKWNFQANDVTTTGTVTATSFAGDGSTLTGVYGQGQTLQDMSASRVSGTSYRNTTGKTIFVGIEKRGGGGDLQYSTDNTTWVSVAGWPSASGSYEEYYAGLPIPHNTYYRISSGGYEKWTELR